MKGEVLPPFCFMHTDARRASSGEGHSPTRLYCIYQGKVVYDDERVAAENSEPHSGDMPDDGRGGVR